jgi:TolB-like protein/Tfp pilus assembly protein PilF
MASLIPGFEYDIFISYRQKDNKGDMWVSEFVEALKTELESTFKEEVSVYFDINPSDGLLETHDVDESLKEKLKCLVFIPIISRTYCDPNSFAWVHEFKAFVEQASKDQFGLKVKLPGGNVANRVLPVQIHDLDAEDRKMVEDELGGYLRGIEFIYKEPGVDRPLTGKDNEEKNLNKTNYRNQINKVALAIREIINAIKQYNPQHEEVSQEAAKSVSAPRKNHKTTIIAGSVIAAALIFLGILFVPKLFKPPEKSIAVLPFNLLSDEPDKQYLADGMMDAITLHLSKIKDLRVVGRTSTEQFRNPTKTLTAIGRELDVSYLLEGSFQKFGDSVRLIVQLIRTGKEGHVWANNYDRSWKNVFSVQSEVAQSVARELKAAITPVEEELIEKAPTTNLTAYDLYLRAKQYQNDYIVISNIIIKNNINAYQKALTFFNAAIETDSHFARAYTGLARLYADRYFIQGDFRESYLDSCLALCNKALSIDDKLDEAYQVKGLYFWYKGHAEEAIKNIDIALKYNPNSYNAYILKAEILCNSLMDYVGGLESYHEAIKLIRGKDRPSLLRILATQYLCVGFFDKAKYYLQEALTLDGDSATYFNIIAGIEGLQGNIESSTSLYEKALRIDPGIDMALELYSFLGRDQEAYKIAQKDVEDLKQSGSLPLKYSHRIGYAFWKVGKYKEADYYLKEQIKYSTESIKQERYYAIILGTANYDLAGVYAFLGEKDKAYQCLDEFNKLSFYPTWILWMAKHDVLFDSIRGEERFQKILQNMESKYQAEHERVRKWLEEQGEL